MLKILAVTGSMGSGKSTVTGLIKAEICKRRSWQLVKFAQPMYDMQEYIYDRAGLTIPKPKDRKLLQWLGSDWGRSIDVNLWVNIWKANAELELKRSPNILVMCDDLRFDNEAEMVKSVGGKILCLEATSTQRAKRIELINSTHQSENGVDPMYIDKVIKNNGSLELLTSKVKELIKEWNI
jgi:dephospho-CoA kinase